LYFFLEGFAFAVIIKKIGLSVVAHTYNPTYLEGRDWEDYGWIIAWAKSE
jgi:hypothetical protein